VLALHIRQNSGSVTSALTYHRKCRSLGPRIVVIESMAMFRLWGPKLSSIPDLFQPPCRQFSGTRDPWFAEDNNEAGNDPEAKIKSGQRRSGEQGTEDQENDLQLLQSITIKEEEIEESFVRGSGPGGQKINKTSSCVMLKHLPTGIVVRCQESRSQHRKRELARRVLQSKIEVQILGERSRLAMEANKERARKAVKRRKAVKKHFKSRRDRAALFD
jgi:peptide chain release factor